MKEKEKSSLVDLGKRLLEASRKGQADEVSVLMASGAPFTTDWLGTSPLHLAAQHGHTQTAEVLLRAGVSRDARTKVDRTPLHMAAQHGHTLLVELLVSSGACTNNRDMLNMTPLHWACEHNHIDIVKILLRAGAKTDIKSKFGKSPVDIARAKGYNEVLLALSSDQDQDLSVAKTQKRPDRSNLALNSMKKRQRTKKFPMTAGSWTGPEGPSENGNKPRRKATTPAGVSPKSAVSGGRRVSAPPQFPNAGSPSLRSPTENSIASLVSAAAIVKAKSESEGGGHTASESKSTSSSTKPQDSSVLDTLATLATATLSHGTPATSTSSVQQVTAMTGRSIGITPLTLPPTTPTLTTPLTPSASLFPLPSPLAALSALSSLSSPAQTSPLSSVTMSPMPFSMSAPQQAASTAAQLMPLGVASWCQSGSPFSNNIATTTGVSIPQALNTPSAASTATDVATSTIASATATADSSVKGVTFSATGTQSHNSQTSLPQHFTIAPIQLSGTPSQTQLQPQLAIGQMLAPIQGVPPPIMLELNTPGSKDAGAQGKIDQADTLKSPNQSQDMTQAQMQQESETKHDEFSAQNIPGTQEVYITVQVPASLQQLQSQLVGADPAFALQQVQLLQQVTGQDPQQHASATQVQHSQIGQQQVAIVQQQDGSTQTPQEQGAGSSTPQAQIVQLQLPQEQLNLAHLMHNVGHGTLPLTFSSPLTPQQMQLLASTQIQIGNQTPQLVQSTPQQRLQQQQQQQTVAGSQQQQPQPPPQQQNIAQQLLAQSVPQRTIIPQTYVTQLSQQAPVQANVDMQSQQQQQPQQNQQTPAAQQTQVPGTFGPHVLLQVQEDLRKLLEQRQAEEDRTRKELEGKLYILQRDSEKYRTELAHAQKEAEDYRGRLEIELREKTRLHQLYEASRQPGSSSSENRTHPTVKSERDALI